MSSLAGAVDAVAAGQTWRCDESQADPADVPKPHDVPLWAPHPRFTAVVDAVESDYVELTVTRRNRHPRAPSPGADVVATVDSLTTDPRWSRVDDPEVADV